MEGVNSRLRDLVLVVGVAILQLGTASSRLLDWFPSGRGADFARVGPESHSICRAQKPRQSAELVVEAAGIEPASVRG